MKKLNYFLSSPVRNGYSPVCTDKPTSKKVLSLGALTGSGLDLTNTKWVPESNEQVDKFTLKVGDFLVSRSNTLDRVGRAALYRGGLLNCSYPDLMMKFRVDETKIQPEFMELILQSTASRKHFMRCASGTSSTMAKITKSTLESLKIPPFSLDSQGDIVNILRTWQNSIEKTEKLIEAKEKQFVWMSQKLFKPTNSWKSYNLSELFENRKESKSTALPLLSITREKGVVPHSETNRKDSSNKDKSKYLRICPNDIGYNTMRMWQGVSALSTLEGIVSPAYTICKPKEGVDSEFMAFLFKTKPMIHKFYRYSQGLTSDTWNLKFHHFSEVKASIPDLQSQVKIANVLKNAQKEISTLKQTVEKYRLQKRGLMQKLLTGEWQAPSQSNKERLKEVKT